MNLEDYNFTDAAEALQDWFRDNARVLPWREEQTPYHVWVSEIMLQQTRVEAVTGYYNRFLEKLPGVEQLAEAPEEVYLKLWEGLGYYSRVRNLHRAAVQIMEEHGGIIPSGYETLLRLPGIGAYTAGAIASLAYGKRVPAVDGNVLRVMMRLSGDSSDISEDSTKKRLQACLQTFYDAPENGGADPRLLNQGLMELGALVCVPNGRPLCEICPVRNFCRAAEENRTEELPVKKAPKARRVEERTVLILEERGRTALHRRPPKGLLAGLWELPNRLGHMETEEVARFVEELGFAPIRVQRTADAKHIFSHVEWHMRGYRVTIEEESFATEQQRKRRAEEGIVFVSPEELRDVYTLPSAFAAFRKDLPSGACGKQKSIVDPSGS